MFKNVDNDLFCNVLGLMFFFFNNYVIIVFLGGILGAYKFITMRSIQNSDGEDRILMNRIARKTIKCEK